VNRKRTIPDIFSKKVVSNVWLFDERLASCKNLEMKSELERSDLGDFKSEQQRIGFGLIYLLWIYSLLVF